MKMNLAKKKGAKTHVRAYKLSKMLPRVTSTDHNYLGTPIPRPLPMILHRRFMDSTLVRPFILLMSVYISVHPFVQSSFHLSIFNYLSLSIRPFKHSITHASASAFYHLKNNLGQPLRARQASQRQDAKLATDRAPIQPLLGRQVSHCQGVKLATARSPSLPLPGL